MNLREREIGDKYADLSLMLIQNIFSLTILKNLLNNNSQGRVEVLFTIFDLDLTTTIGPTSDIVDNIFSYPDVTAVSSADGPFSDPVVFTGNASYSHLQLSFRLTCRESHYTSACIYCVPTNDSTGHYNCDNSTGEKVCLEGYQGADCIDCVPASDCSEYITNTV